MNFPRGAGMIVTPLGWALDGPMEQQLEIAAPMRPAVSRDHVTVFRFARMIYRLRRGEPNDATD
jgi:hypothetical protein